MKSQLPGLSFLIPAYNDESTVERVVAESAEVGQKVAEKYEIIVINDGSRDRTLAVLRRLTKKFPFLTALTHPVNQGYGQTIKELYYAGRHGWLFTLPGDYQISPSEITKLLPFTGQADMIIGWRVKRNDPPLRLRQSGLYNFLLRRLFGLSLHDTNSVRLMKREMMEKIRLSASSAFVDAELAIRAKRLGYRVVEVPIGHHRREGASGGGGKLKTILPVLADMFKWFFWQEG